MAIDFRIRDFAYPLTIWSLRRTLERTQWMSPRELENHQLERLDLVLHHGYENVPYYRRLFDKHDFAPGDVRGIDDLRRLPILTKDQARRAGKSLHARNASRYLPKVHTTSGTTGMPLKFLLDKGANALEFAYYWRHWSWAGYRLGDRFVEINTTHFLRRPRLKDTVAVWQPHLRRLLLNGALLSRRHIGEMAGAVRKHRAKFIKGLASTLFYLAFCLEEAGVEDISFRAAFSTGEVLSQAYRDKIAAVFHCTVMDSYGHMERTAAICQCPHGGYHLNSDYGILELVDTRASGAFGTVTGRSVGTSLYNLAMPLIRYDIGDILEMYTRPATCRCGRTLPLIRTIRGRTQDIIKTPDGRYITAVYILPEFVSGVGFAQFVQESQSDMSILVVPAEDWNPAEEEKLKSCAARLLGPSMRIEIRTVRQSELVSLPTGKQPVVISRRR